MTTEELEEMFEELEEMLEQSDLKNRSFHVWTSTMRERIKHFGVYDPSYEVKVNRLRGLIENSYKYMTLNTFKQKVPRETLLHFKETMSDVSSVVRRNKGDRVEDNN